jgi:hypothetical protein
MALRALHVETDARIGGPLANNGTNKIQPINFGCFLVRDMREIFK